MAETSGVCNITDRLSGLTINSSVDGDGTHGGFISVQTTTKGGNITMRGCTFSGSLLGAKTNSCGGFIGWRNKGLSIYNSIFAPASVTIGDANSAMFARNPGDTFNSYYLYPLGEDSGNQWEPGFSVTAGENTTVNTAGDATEYKTANIKSVGTCIQYNGVVYAGEGANVPLVLGESHPVGMVCGGYTANAGNLTGNENPFTLTMPASNVVVTANFIPSPYRVGDYMNGRTAYELKELDDSEKRASICGVAKDDVRQDVKAIVLTKSLEEAKEDAQRVLVRGQWPKFYFTKNGKGGVRRKTYLDSVCGTPPTNLWHYSDVGHTDEAAKSLKAIFGGNTTFDTPKPSRLIERVLQM